MTDIHEIEVGHLEVRLRIGGENAYIKFPITAKDIINYRTMRGAIERNLIEQYRAAWDDIFDGEDDG